MLMTSIRSFIEIIAWGDGCCKINILVRSCFRIPERIGLSFIEHCMRLLLGFLCRPYFFGSNEVNRLDTWWVRKTDKSKVMVSRENSLSKVNFVAKYAFIPLGQLILKLNNWEVSHIWPIFWLNNSLLHVPQEQTIFEQKKNRFIEWNEGIHMRDFSFILLYNKTLVEYARNSIHHTRYRMQI